MGSAHSVWTTLALPQLTAPVLSWSTLLRLQVAPKRNCPKWPLCCMHFPGLSCSGSGSQTFHKGTDLVGPAFCALPRSKQLRRPGAWQAHCPRWSICLNHLASHSRLVPWVHCKSTVSGVPCISSGELIPRCNPPGRCQPSRISGRLG